MLIKSKIKDIGPKIRHIKSNDFNNFPFQKHYLFGESETVCKLPDQTAQLYTKRLFQAYIIRLLYKVTDFVKGSRRTYTPTLSLTKKHKVIGKTSYQRSLFLLSTPDFTFPKWSLISLDMQN